MTVRSEEGAAGTDMARLNRLAELPGDVDALMALLIAQFASQAGMRLGFSSTGTKMQARDERVRLVVSAAARG